MRFTLFISLLLAILAVVFALQNPGLTDVNVFGFAYEGSKALILIITFGIGILVGVLATLPSYIRNRRKVSSLRKTIAEDRTQTHREEQVSRPTEEPPPAQRTSPRTPPEEPGPADSSSRPS